MGCKANGIDQDCAWCVEDMSKCDAAYREDCHATDAARRSQGVLGCTSVVSGQGDWRFQYMPDLLNLPASETNNDLNGHGLCQDMEGNIYFTFVPKEVTDETQVLVKFSPDGKGATLLGQKGPRGLSGGVPHGLRLEYDTATGESFLYHANNDATVIKTTINGTELWRANFSSWRTERPEYWPYKPTNVIVVPGSNVLLVADGYGSSFIHSLDKMTGKFLENKTFGGKGSTTTPLRFNTPHGINLDMRRSGSLVVSDRSNSRLVWIDFKGTFLDAMPTTSPPGMALPCNVDVASYEYEGVFAVVPSLGVGYSNLTQGSAAIYDSTNKLLSVIEVANTIGHLGHQHPHDALLLPNGDAVICCWSGPGNPGQGPAKGTISYWKRLRSTAALIV
jgi:hypothetical protein